MSLKTGQEVELLVEKAASGGRMIARHEGEVVLVAGAIPGERVAAIVARAAPRARRRERARGSRPRCSRLRHAGRRPLPSAVAACRAGTSRLQGERLDKGLGPVGDHARGSIK